MFFIFATFPGRTRKQRKKPRGKMTNRRALRQCICEPQPLSWIVSEDKKTITIYAATDKYGRVVSSPGEIEDAKRRALMQSGIEFAGYGIRDTFEVPDAETPDKIWINVLAETG